MVLPTYFTYCLSKQPRCCGFQPQAVYTWSDCIGELAVIGWWSLAPAATLNISVKRSSRACLLFHLNLSSNFHPRRVSWCTGSAATQRPVLLARSLPSFLPSLRGAGLRCATTLKNGLPVGAQTDCQQCVLEIVEGKDEYGREEGEVNLTHQRSSLCCVFFSFLAPFSSKFIGNFLRSFPSLRSPKLA